MGWFSDMLGKIRRPRQGEVATMHNALSWLSSFGWLPNPDEILKKLGKDMSEYRKLRIDSHTGACILSRKSGVKKLLWHIKDDAAEQRVIDLITDLFKTLPLHQDIIPGILESVLYGYQPLEIIWHPSDGLYLPQAVIPKPPEWFLFSEDRALLFRSKTNWLGEPVEPYKFLLAQNEATYINPYGFANLSSCWWPAMFKKGGLKFWAIFVEKYGMPLLIGKHPRGAKKEEIDELADMLERAVTDAILTIPDDSSTEIQESGSKQASSDVYNTFNNAMNAEISKALLGQTLSTEVGDKGSYAASKSHMEVRDDIIDSDRLLVESILNQLIRWVVDINFGKQVAAPSFEMYEEDDVDTTLAERDRTLSEPLRDSGLRFSKPYYMKNYGLEEDDLEPAPERPNPLTGFSEGQPHPFPHDKAIDTWLDKVSGAELDAQTRGMVTVIQKAVNKAESYEEMLSQLTNTYTDLPIERIQSMLARAFLIADVWGAHSVKEE